MAFKMNLKQLVAFSCQLSLRAILMNINRDRVRVPQGYLEWIEVSLAFGNTSSVLVTDCILFGHTKMFGRSTD